MARVYPDNVFLEHALPKLEAFWKGHILPELVCRSLERRKQTSNAEEYHCSCGAADKIPMVGCDGVNCNNQWYHWECVGLKSEPRSTKWYCELCRGSNMKNIKRVTKRFRRQ